MNAPAEKRNTTMAEITPSEKLAIGVLIDASGSMLHHLPAIRTGLARAKASAIRHGVPMGVWSFSDWKAPAARALVALDESDPAAAERALLEIEIYGGTILAPALLEVGSALRARPARHRVLVVLMDGAVADAEQSIEVVQSLEGFTVLGLFVGEPFPELVEDAFRSLGVPPSQFQMARGADEIEIRLRGLFASR